MYVFIQCLCLKQEAPQYLQTRRLNFIAVKRQMIPPTLYYSTPQRTARRRADDFSCCIWYNNVVHFAAPISVV